MALDGSDTIAEAQRPRAHPHSQPVRKLLVANRGEIALRIARTAAELGIASVAVHPADDAASQHVFAMDEAVQLPGRGAAAYLEVEALLAAALQTGATAVHPGYGFLSEQAPFAAAVEAAGLTFVGPTPDTLALFGDKHRARGAASAHGLPVLPGTAAPTSLAEAQAFLGELGDGAAVMVKAAAGGGGRGMRAVTAEADLEAALARCSSEAETAFGSGAVYVEQLIPRARHVEVQIVGDGADVTHLWERECSVQRRRQKLIEMAPAPALDPTLREQLLEAAVRLGRAAHYRGLGTVEFLLDTDAARFYFVEANARLQVEHTVTEAVTGLDLVAVQLRIGAGESLAALGLETPPPPRGAAMQLRVNTERMTAEGDPQPTGGLIEVYEPPSGPGVRVDGCGYAGYRTHPGFDSLLAKVIVHTGSERPAELLNKARRALREFRIDGPETNLGFLRAILDHPAFAALSVHTDFVESHAEALLAASARSCEARHPGGEPPAGGSARHAGARLAHDDPLAVLDYGQAPTAAAASSEPALADGLTSVVTPMQGTVVSLAHGVGERVRRGAELAVIEAMKMEHVVRAELSGVIAAVLAAPGDTLWEGQRLMVLEPVTEEAEEAQAARDVDLDAIRPDLAEVLERRAKTRDEARPEAVARRRRTGQRTAWENVHDLVDADSFVEYGPLTVAAQRRRRSLEDLIQRSPADGLITGVGSVNGEAFGDPASRTAVMAYDYTVFAGTQGVHNHWKTDRLIDVAEQGRMPLVLFAEGGGGRPGDADYGGFVGQNTFHHFGQLSGLVPMVGIVSGRCFAGNAALLGCCDVIIATRGANIGMGGPAMVEGGGLGVFKPEDIGPIDVQSRNGVVDVAVEDERQAVDAARRYLGYFQGTPAALGRAGPETDADAGAGEPAARLCRAAGDRHARR